MRNFSRREENGQRTNNATESERKVMEDWKQRDEQIETKLEDINILLDEIKQQAEQQGQVTRPI